MSFDSNTNKMKHGWPKPCSVCNAQISQASKLRCCLHCNVNLCKNCSEYGLCPDHFQELSDQDKQIFKKKYRSPQFFTWFISILILGILGPYIFFELDFHTGAGLGLIIVMASIEISLLIFYIIITILRIRYQRNVKPSLLEIIKKYKDMNRDPGFVKMTSTDAALEKIIDFYRQDERVRMLFGDKELRIEVKFLDTNRIYSLKIQQGDDISLEPNSSMERSDIKIKIQTEQVLFDVMNKDVPFSDALLARNIRISKGGFKFLRLTRKAPYKLGDILQQ